MHVSRAVFLLMLVLLQVARGSRIPRGLVGSGYGGASGGGACKFWCEGGGGQYFCCQTPEQTSLQGGGHLPQTSGGYGVQGINNFGNNFGNNLGHHGVQTSGYGTQGVNNFANNFGHHGVQTSGYGTQGVNNFGNNFGQHGVAGNNFALQGNNFGSHGSYIPQVTHGSYTGHTGFRPTHGVNQGGFRPTHGVNQGGFSPSHGVSQGGYSSNNNNNNLASIFSSVVQGNNNQPQGHNNNRPQGHSSNFVSNPSIVTPLGQTDAISTHNNGGFDANNFAFQGSNQGPNYPFDIRGLIPKKS